VSRCDRERSSPDLRRERAARCHVQSRRKGAATMVPLTRLVFPSAVLANNDHDAATLL